jgi:hypothetical protein
MLGMQLVSSVSRSVGATYLVELGVAKGGCIECASGQLILAMEWMGRREKRSGKRGSLSSGSGAGG